MTSPSDLADHRKVEINAEPIELYKILKFEGLVTSGGEAKAVVAAGKVHVNGKPELQKRKKIVAGDTIEYGDEKILIARAPSSPEIKGSNNNEG